MKNELKKLRQFIYQCDDCVFSIFGTLMDRDVEFVYEDENGEWQHWTCCGIYGGEKDFLLDYYVAGIRPEYKIKDDKIILYLKVILHKTKEVL